MSSWDDVVFSVKELQAHGRNGCLFVAEVSQTLELEKLGLIVPFEDLLQAHGATLSEFLAPLSREFLGNSYCLNKRGGRTRRHFVLVATGTIICSRPQWRQAGGSLFDGARMMLATPEAVDALHYRKRLKAVRANAKFAWMADMGRRDGRGDVD